MISSLRELKTIAKRSHGWPRLQLLKHISNVDISDTSKILTESAGTGGRSGKKRVALLPQNVQRIRVVLNHFRPFSLMPAVVDGCINLILYVFLGLYGNVWLFESLETKLEDGFQHLQNHRYTHPIRLSVLSYFLPTMLRCLLGLILIFSSTMSTEKLSTIIHIYDGFFHIAIGGAALFLHKWEKQQAQQASNQG